MTVYVCRHCNVDVSPFGVCVIVSTGSDESIVTESCPYDRENKCSAEWHECNAEEIKHAMSVVNNVLRAEDHLEKISR